MNSLFLGILSLAAAGQNAYYWTKLPERVATHFGAQGDPDGWMDRNSATMLMLVVQLVIPWFIVGIAYATKYMPASLINIPNREYWLAPERRVLSLFFMQRFVTAIACVMSMFMMAVNHLTFRANMAATSLNMQAFVLVMALFLISVGVLVVAMWRRFRLPT